MMTILLIVCTLGIIILGFAVMRHIDHFIAHGGIIDSPQGRANQGVLVYGAQGIADILQKHGVKYRVLAEPFFPDDGYYSSLFALSSNDDNNLIICHAANQADSGIYIVARCNAFLLREIYADAGANYILGADESIDTLLVELWGKDT